MKVLMLSHMYPSPVNPTAGVFVHEQVKALVRLGHDVRVMSPTAWAPPLVPRYRAHRAVPRTDVIETVPVIYPTKMTLPGARLGVRNADAMLMAIRRLCHRIHGRWRFDVIHAHMLVPDGWAAAAVGAELAVPVLATTHRADVLDLPRRGRAQRDQVVQAIESVDQITAVSRAIRDAATDLGTPRREPVVVPNGADTRVFVRRDADEVRERLNLPRDRQIISYVGKLVPRKGVDTLIEAFGLLGRRDKPTPLLVMAGIGEMRDSLESRARELGVADDLRFVGKVPHDDVALWMAAGDVFVLPSLSEGLPTVICEAMNCGRPVVATAVDGTPEIVRHGETGFLVEPTRPGDLADALARVLDDPSRAEEMGRRAHEIGVETYTWDANAARTAELYRAIVA